MIKYNVEELTEELYSKTSGLMETFGNLKGGIGISGVSEDSISAAIELMRSQGARTYVAVTDEKEIIGTAKIVLEQKLIRELGVAGRIEDVVTRKGYEGIGVQSELLREAIDYATERGCYKVTLSCHEGLVVFYEKFGFKTHSGSMRLSLE